MSEVLRPFADIPNTVGFRCIVVAKPPTQGHDRALAVVAKNSSTGCHYLTWEHGGRVWLPAFAGWLPVSQPCEALKK